MGQPVQTAVATSDSSGRRVPGLRGAALGAALRPSVASMGYALFLAVNAAGVWGGVFPFLPMGFQTPTIVFWFFFAQSLTFAAGFFLNALVAYRWPSTARSFIVKLTVAPYMAGWVALIAATYVDAAALPLVAAGGALLGVGSAEFYTLWQRLFASQQPEEGGRDLVLGTAYAALLYFALYLIPVAVTAFLIPLVFLPLFGLAIVLRSRDIDLDQPMFEDVPREHPAVYRRAVGSVWRSAFCVGGLGLCAGVMRSLAIAEPKVGSLVNALSMGALLVAALALLGCWRVRGLRLNIVTMYRVFFPFAITGLLALPFLGTDYLRWLAAGLYALYSVGIVLMMAQCAQTSRDSGINPVFIYGVFAGIVYALHDVGFIAGSLAEGFGGALTSVAVLAGIPANVLVALVAVYLLGLIYFVGQGGFRGAFGLGRGAQAEGIEFVAPAGRGGVRRAGRRGGSGAPGVEEGNAASGLCLAAEGSRAPGARGEGPAVNALAEDEAEPLTACELRDDARGDDVPSSPQYRDRVSKQVEVLRRHYGLSAREAEVMELIARGASVPRIAERLVLSENTIRTHSKRIYAKLAIHKKQDLIDLINEFDPRELEGRAR